MTAISETVEAPEREMTRCAAAILLRHVGEEWLHLRFDAELGIGRLDPADILGPRLLGDLQPRALRLRQCRKRRRNRIGEELRALAAAEHQQPERLAGSRRRVGRCRCLDDGRTHRIAGERRSLPGTGWRHR